MFFEGYNLYGVEYTKLKYIACSILYTSLYIYTSVTPQKAPLPTRTLPTKDCTILISITTD